MTRRHNPVYAYAVKQIARPAFACDDGYGKIGWITHISAALLFRTEEGAREFIRREIPQTTMVQVVQVEIKP